MVDSTVDAKKLLEKSKIPYHTEDGKSGIYLHFQDIDGTELYFVEPKWK